MKTITILDNDTRESLIITTDAYMLAHLVKGEVKIQGQISPDALGPLLKRYGAQIFSNMFK